MGCTVNSTGLWCRVSGYDSTRLLLKPPSGLTGTSFIFDRHWVLHVIKASSVEVAVIVSLYGDWGGGGLVYSWIIHPACLGGNLAQKIPRLNTDEPASIM